MCWGFHFTVTDDGVVVEDRCVNGVKELRELVASRNFSTTKFIDLFDDVDDELDDDSCLCGIDVKETCLLVARVIIKTLGWFDWLDRIELDDIDPAVVIGHLIKEGIDHLTTVGFSSDTKEVKISWL